jgi:hypothetical protein
VKKARLGDEALGGVEPDRAGGAEHFAQQPRRPAWAAAAPGP